MTESLLDALWDNEQGYAAARQAGDYDKCSAIAAEMSRLNRLLSLEMEHGCAKPMPVLRPIETRLATIGGK